MSAVSTKKANNINLFKFKSTLFSMNRVSSQLYKVTVLLFVVFLLLTLVGCGSDRNSVGNESSGDDNSSVVIKNRSIASGYHQSFIIDDGQVYAVGKNSNNQLGLGDTVNRTVFIRILSLSDIAAIASGNVHSLALSNDGRVYGLGANQDGRLGLGDTDNRTAFTEISFLSDKNITAIAVANKHSLVLSNDGRVYAAGTNSNGQLGIGDNKGHNTFIEALFLRDKNIVVIDAGHDHSLALSNDGKVYAAGDNYYGQLGLGDNDDRNTFTEVASLSDKNIVAIVAGYSHSFVISNDGRVYAAGKNDKGQLGLGDNNDCNTFIEVSSLKDINTIATGNAHSIILTNDGKVYTTGFNQNGQLGLGDNTDRNTFTEVAVP